jgi:preflagellin peptidase FlaK
MLVGNPLPFPLTILFNSVILLFPVLLVYVLIRRLQGRSALYERVEMDRLREGMIPAETIYEKDGKIYRWGSGFGFKPKWDKRYTNPSRASGLTRYQIGVLRRLARQRKIENFLKIKKGLPFAPAFLVGLATALLFGDIYLRIILWLIGA